jgi:hypothetical protein
LDPEGQPAATQYLKKVGLNPSDAVKLVVVTHWHDDHVQGIARITEECGAASVAFSAALNEKDAFQFVLAEEQRNVGIGTGVDELRAILRLDASRLVLGKALAQLFPRPPAPGPVVMALAPSDHSVLRGVAALVARATNRPASLAGRIARPESANATSLVAQVALGEIAALFGGDLENSTNPSSGWDAVVALAKQPQTASLVKVPHHASDDAHHDGMWTELVDPDFVAIITPFVNGRIELPREVDLLRIVERGGRVFLTSRPRLEKVRLERETEKVLRHAGGKQLTQLRAWGHVRARRSQDEPSWRVDLDGDARELLVQ